MQLKRTIMLTLLTVLLSTAAAMAEDVISFTSIAEVETEMFDANGKKQLVRSPAQVVNPGEIAVYTNSFTNNGQQAVGDLVINNPVPKNTEYLEGSATEEGYLVTFSVDGGKTFDQPANLTVKDEDGEIRKAEAKDYTNIRWKRDNLLDPGQTDSVEFRVRVI